MKRREIDKTIGEKKSRLAERKNRKLQRRIQALRNKGRFSQVRNNLARMKQRRLGRKNLKKDSIRSGQTLPLHQKVIVTRENKTILTGV